MQKQLRRLACQTGQQAHLWRWTALNESISEQTPWLDSLYFFYFSQVSCEDIGTETTKKNRVQNGKRGIFVTLNSTKWISFWTIFLIDCCRQVVSLSEETNLLDWFSPTVCHHMRGNCSAWFTSLGKMSLLDIMNCFSSQFLFQSIVDFEERNNWLAALFMVMWINFSFDGYVNQLSAVPFLVM